MERPIELQLEKLRTRIIKMSSLVDEQVELAIRCIQQEQPELIPLITERDQKIDAYDLKIDKTCQKIFALNHPLAQDLRIIMAALTINSNLERIGDIAVNIAQNYHYVGSKPEFFTRTCFPQMAEIVREMLRLAIDSFINIDARLAQVVIQKDRELDRLNKENHRIMIEIMKERTEYIEPAVALLVISRQLERIGDHATNIAEDIYFIKEAQVIKHSYDSVFNDEDESGDDE